MSSVTVVANTHSVIEYSLNYSGTIHFVRSRAAVAPSTCTSATGGWVIPSDYMGVNLGLNPVSIAVTGLSPNTTYNICPEISSDGSNWYGGIALNATTQALPAIHPVPPVAAATSVTAPPNISAGYNYKTNTSAGAYTVVNVKTQSDCANLQHTYYTAIGNQMQNGTVIKFAPGLACQQQVNLEESPTSGYFPGDVLFFGASNVSTSANTITISNHGFTEGQQIIFATWYSTLPSSTAGYVYGADAYGSGPNPSNTLISGWTYYCHVVDANTIQVYSGASAANGGTLLQFSGAGSGTQMEVMPWPRHLNWIVTCTALSTCGAAAETAFVPQGTRIQGPQTAPTSATAPVNWQPTYPTNWLAQTGTLLMPSNHVTGPSDITSLLSFSAWDGGAESPNANMYFIGMHFGYAPNLEITDKLGTLPWPRQPMIITDPWNQNIVFDRTIFDAPNLDRVAGAFRWNGINQTIENSWISGMHYWHSAIHNLDGSCGNCGGTNGVWLGATPGSPTATLTPGIYNYGYDSVTVPSTVTFTLGGTPTEPPASTGTPALDAWVYFSPLNKALMVALPPGMTATCSGYSPCYTFALGTAATGLFQVNETTPTFPASAHSNGYLYFVEPVVSTSSACTSTTSLFPSKWYDAAGTAANNYNGGSSFIAEAGTQFWPDANLYHCGWNIYVNPADTATSHTVSLWTSGGTLLAQQTAATAIGKNFIANPTPTALTGNTNYVVSYQYHVADSEWAGAFQNYDPNGGLTNTVHASQYVASNGDINYADNWPQDPWNSPAVVRNSLITFAAGSPNVVTIARSDPFADGWDTEGCQCMIGSYGPGPYEYTNNYGEMSGTAWHHDDGGGNWAWRGDYTYTRNYSITPGWALIGTSQSNGNDYAHRHIHEWKSGARINFSGNVVGGGLLEDTPIGDCIEFAGDNGLGITDVSIANNTWAHCGFGLSGPYLYPGGGEVHPPYPTARILFQNNLIWDINGQTWCAHNAPNTNGWGFCNGTYSVGGWGTQIDTYGAEDFQISHNTFVYPQAQGADFLWWGGPGVQEGIKVTDNILFVNQASGYNDGFDPGQTCGAGGTDASCYGAGKYCRNLSGLAAWNCATLNSPMHHNVMTGAINQASMQSLWGGTGNYVNYIPADPTNAGALGWFNYRGLTSWLNNYRLKANYCSGCGSPASDGTDVGANIDSIDVAQGIVTGVGISNITSASAQVNFVAPDNQSCPLDYSATDSTLTSSFTRLADGGSGRVRNLTISGLSTHTLYYFRVNCAVQQPSGQFKTN